MKHRRTNWAYVLCPRQAITRKIWPGLCRCCNSLRMDSSLPNSSATTRARGTASSRYRWIFSISIRAQGRKTRGRGDTEMGRRGTGRTRIKQEKRIMRMPWNKKRKQFPLVGVIAAGIGAWLALGTLNRLRIIRQNRFRDCVVMITGGSRGLGLQMARLLAEEGAKLVLLARNAP